MAGHSHWAGIKHKKGVLDAKRGKLFSKLAKNIMVAIKESGGNTDLGTNLKLRYAIDKAKEANMPKANIERVIKRATGVAGGAGFSELSYEGYAAGGVAVMAEIITDNRNRIASEMPKIFDKAGGKLGASGCVSYMFDAKGVIIVPKEAVAEDKLMDIALEAGAEDMVVHEEVYEVTTEPSALEDVKSAIEAAEIDIESAEVTKLPKSTITINNAKTAKKVLALVNALEDHDDVENVYANYDIPDDLMASIEDDED